MGNNEELEKMLDETLEQMKIEHAKILKLLQNNGDKCFGDGTNFATMEEYSIAVGTLSNTATYSAQLNQAKLVQKAQRDNVVQLHQNAKEAKK